jgi:hypothetical protein
MAILANAQPMSWNVNTTKIPKSGMKNHPGMRGGAKSIHLAPNSMNTVTPQPIATAATQEFVLSSAAATAGGATLINAGPNTSAASNDHTFA